MTDNFEEFDQSVVDDCIRGAENNNYDFYNDSEDPRDTDLAILREEIKDKTAEAETYKSKYLYVLADFDNYKKRTNAEKEDMKSAGIEKVIKDILPIIDDFERSLKHLSYDNKDGVTLIYNKFINILKSYNVYTIDPKKGSVFNDKYHDAISTVCIEGVDNKHIVECINKGYMINDKVIRYANVIVNITD